MEVEEIQTQACKFSRVVGNGRNNDSAKIGSKGDQQKYPDDEDDGELKTATVTTNITTTTTATNNNNGDSIEGGGAAFNQLRGWHPSSRIIRVSRASGGKDRHSKVWTSKGLRDRRVRLSVTTAIQFYDLQDRLGYDQPSKAVEWLIKAASDAIAELPSLNSSFPETPKQLSDEKRGSEEQEQEQERGFDSAVDLDLGCDQTNNSFGHHQDKTQTQQQQHISLSKSACSSTSDTSKGSGLSLSRSDVRVNRGKARERARERAAREKEKENECRMNVNPISQSSSFTELLTAGINSVANNNHSHNHITSPSGSSAHQNQSNGEPIFFPKAAVAAAAAAAARQWSAAAAAAAAAATPMDYFGAGLLGQSSSSRGHAFPGQIQLGNPLPQSMSMTMSPFNLSGENHQELQPPQHFSFVHDHLIPVTTTTTGGGGGSGGGGGGGGSGDYNLNFTISSSSLAGFNNRGTLQSNSSSSPSLLVPPLLQRFASPVDGSNVPFFIGTTTTTTTPSMENHQHHHHHHHNHQFPPGLDGRLQLCYGDGTSSRHHSDQKGKGKH